MKSDDKKHKRKILIVDDVEHNRSYLKHFLSTLDLDTLEAVNGQDALKILINEKVDLMLLDILMPVMNGEMLIDEINKRNMLRLTKIIVISAVDEVKLVSKCIEKGAEDYLTKPFNPILLKARIKNVLKKIDDDEKELKIYDEMLKNMNKLLEYNQNRNNITSMIVHDLNNPLSVIKSYGQYIQFKRNESKTNFNFLDHILQAVKDMEVLINDLSDMNQKKDFNFELKNNLVCLNSFLEDIVKFFNTDVQYSQNFIYENFSEKLMLDTDESLLRRIMINLLDNAQKYSPKECDIKVILTLKNNKILIKVIDQGEGVKKEFREEIFKKKYRLPEHKKVKTGQGLGLFFCKKAIAVLNGLLYYDDEYDLGSCFTICFEYEK